ncbi:MAG: histidine phosphatase family protein [Acidimicrobiia bacterium]
MELWFVRHAQPAWAVDGLTQRDPYLTELGHRQAQLLADRLASLNTQFTGLLVSSALRSQQTAEPVAAALEMDIETFDGLTEIMMPDWSDTPEATVQQIFNESYQRPPTDWWEGIDGGESFRDFHNRITTTVDGILKSHGVTRDSTDPTQLWEMDPPDERLLLVAHGGTNAVALAYLLGAEATPWEWERFVLGHASIASLVAMGLGGGHILSMRTFNDREHLPEDMRTR